MGFWDVGVGDLESMGVRVTQEQEAVLEWGGEVMIVRPLLSPLAIYDDNGGMIDQCGQKVFVPRTMRAYPPRTAGLPWVPAGTPAEYLEDELGADWRSWPSYVGEYIDDPIDQQAGEGVQYARIWEGTPLVSEDDKNLATDLWAAAKKRVNDSVYYEYVMLQEFIASYDMGCLDKLLDNETTAEAVVAGTAVTPEYLSLALGAYVTLLDGRYLARTAKDVGRLRPVCFAPMEDYLVCNNEARAMWRRAINRRENTLAIIHTSLSDKHAAHFNREERGIA